MILEKDRQWFYINIWPGCDPISNAVTISPDVDADTPISEISITLNTDELIAITEFIKEVNDISELKED